ncbi:unnamed protein product [Rhizophagus irregularis]|uniref:Uncharacterized protein n=1 Tax=Rhizophagus irregularis TaxID=588596 RepID=A0A916EGM5_9GLOM|nr:unnamed protein product [Rhizophagus irregularis]
MRFPCRNILSSFRPSDIWEFAFLFRRPKNDFGGSSALQQGILAFLSVLKRRLVCNFLLTWDFDGRSLKGENGPNGILWIPSEQFPSAFDFGLECQVPPSGFNLGFLLQVLSSVELWMQKRILENLLDRVPVTGKL